MFIVLEKKQLKVMDKDNESHRFAKTPKNTTSLSP